MAPRDASGSSQAYADRLKLAAGGDMTDIRSQGENPVTSDTQGIAKQVGCAAADRLPQLEEIEPLGPSDSACLEEIRDVLVRHSAIERFGITLLHDHFDVALDEVLVESCDPENRVLTVTPARIGGVSDEGRLVETNWRFGRRGEVLASLVCRVGCFVDLKDKHRRTHQRVNG